MPLVYFVIQVCLLPVLFATAWDVAVITKQDIEFFRNGSAIGVGHGYLKDLSVGAYDPVRGYLYVSDSTHPNTSIFRVNTQSVKDIDPSAIIFEPVISKQASVQGIAYDPVIVTLFWTTGKGNTILKYTVPEINASKSTLQHPGTVLFSFDDGSIPRGIAVDSCRKTVYWTNIKPFAATIEKSNYDGSERRVIAPSSRNVNVKLFQPYGIVVDQSNGHLYWCDAFEGNFYQIVRSDLDGGHAEIIISHSGQEPYSLSIAGDRLFWTDQHYGNFYSLPIRSDHPFEPVLVKKFGQSVQPDGVISNTLYLNLKTDECPDVEPIVAQVSELYQKESPILSSVRVDADFVSVNDNCSTNLHQCLNYGNLSGGVCKCPLGYKGARCEQSVCNNYCINGSCEVDVNGQPICTCVQGWSGLRCQTDECHGHCLNGGFCVTVQDVKEPICECTPGFAGHRCEFQSNLVDRLCKVYCGCHEVIKTHNLDLETMHNFKSLIDSFSEKTLQHCSCPESQKSTVSDSYETVNDYENTKDHERQPLLPKLGGHSNAVLIVILAVSCVFLGGLVVILTSKVLKLRKRPRIRKRIVVNRPTAPFCRPQTIPDQCEITIENCCNMNVCETPCFEPEFQSSKPTFSKKKSEDKKSLITSMYSNSSLDDENH